MNEPVASPPWRLLSREVGVQEARYGEPPRRELRQLFGQPPRRVLDVGCASGAVCAGLKQDYPGVWAWGCELNEASAQAARERLDMVTTVPRPDWSERELALVASVDTVLLLDVLEHMYNPWAELEFLAQNLAADAQVIVSLPNVAHGDVLQALAHGDFPYTRIGILDITHLRFFTLAGMRRMFAETGFAVEAAAAISVSNADVRVESFPLQVNAGKLQLRVDTPDEWVQLNAIQFGFRLRPIRD